MTTPADDGSLAAVGLAIHADLGDLSGPDRQFFEPALARLIAAGQVEMEEVERGIRYRAAAE